MPNLLPSSLLRVNIYVEQAGQVSINRRFFYVTFIGVGNPPSILTAATALAGLLKPLYQPLMATTATFRGLTMQQVTPNLLDPELITDAGAGTGTGDPLPLETAGLISFRTGFGGRKNRGRTYVPFPPEGSNDATGRPTAPYITALATLGSFLANDINIAPGGADAPYTLRGLIIPSDQAQGRVVTNYSVKARWASMRTRGDYSAANVSPV